MKTFEVFKVKVTQRSRAWNSSLVVVWPFCNNIRKQDGDRRVYIRFVGVKVKAI